MDREKIIKGLHDIGRQIINTVGHCESRDFVHTIDDALALLKEQEERIKTFELEKSWDEHPDTMGKW